MFNNFYIETFPPRFTTWNFSSSSAAANVVCGVFQWTKKDFSSEFPDISSLRSVPQLNECEFYTWHGAKRFQYRIARWIVRTELFDDVASFGRVCGSLNNKINLWQTKIQWKQYKFRGDAKSPTVESSVKICKTIKFSHLKIKCQLPQHKKRKSWAPFSSFCLHASSICCSRGRDPLFSHLWLDHSQKVSENIIHQIKFSRQFM